VDACPGRLNEVFLNIQREAHVFGQCSEICGINHAFMPIHVQAVPLNFYEEKLIYFNNIQNTESDLSDDEMYIRTNYFNRIAF
jgi:heme/copper-type cytochrome/quinol oxidase subunit 2